MFGRKKTVSVVASVPARLDLDPRDVVDPAEPTCPMPSTDVPELTMWHLDLVKGEDYVLAHSHDFGANQDNCGRVRKANGEWLGPGDGFVTFTRITEITWEWKGCYDHFQDKTVSYRWVKTTHAVNELVIRADQVKSVRVDRDSPLFGQGRG